MTATYSLEPWEVEGGGGGLILHHSQQESEMRVGQRGICSEATGMFSL